MNRHVFSFRRRLLYSTAAIITSAGMVTSAHAAVAPTSIATETTDRLPDARAQLTPDGYIPPVSTITLPTRPLYPSRAAVTSAPGAPIAYAPPVEASVTPRPAANVAAKPVVTQPIEVQAAPAIAAPASTDVLAQTGFIAPAPVFALPAPTLPAAAVTPPPAPPQVTALPEPLAAPDALQAATVTAAPRAPSVAPVVVTPRPIAIATAPRVIAPAVVAPKPVPAIASAAEDALSNESKTILSHIPSQIDTVKAKKAKNIAMSRVSPEVQELLGNDPKVDAYESVGLSIKVRRPGLDTNHELGRAFNALMAGETQDAVRIYKDILSVDAKNQDALFGLAATYHRLGDLEKARPLYGALLKLNPNHREGLNNFLALVSDESPQEALAELGRLEERNPQFSPIPAQIAILLDKLGYVVEAREKMLHAIDLAPENLTYKYNLAVMLDRQGSFADASALYRLLIDAALKGAIIPASSESLQKRLNYIATAANVAAASGS